MTSSSVDSQICSRPLTAQEEIYWRLTYTDQIHPVFAAEVTGRTQIDQWRRSFDSVQRRHPLLQVAIAMPGAVNSQTHPIFVPKPGRTIPLRVRDFSEDAEVIAGEIRRELAMPFVCGSAPLARAGLLHAPERSVLILSLSHSIADGMSVVFLLRDLIASLSGQELQVLPMPPSAEELLGLTSAVPVNAKLDENTPLRNAGREPSVSLRSVPIGLERKLIAEARAHSATVHGALTAAFVLAMRQLRPRFNSEPVRVISPVSTRAELGAGEALGMYFASPQISFDPDVDRSFWDIATRTRAEIAKGATRGALLDTTAGMRSLTGAGLNNDSAASLLKGAFAMDLLLSNLGRIPFNLNMGELRVERIWGPAVLAGPEAQAIGIVTNEDQLCLTLTSREPVPNLLDTAISLLSEHINYAS